MAPTSALPNSTLSNVPRLRFPGFEGEWERVPLEALAPHISSGRSHPSSGSIPLIGSIGIIGQTSNADYKGRIILVARVGANAGTINYYDGECGITDNTLIVKPTNQDIFNCRYVFHYLKFKGLNKYVFGSGQPLITGAMLKKLSISYGEESEMNKIVSLLDTLDQRISIQNKTIEDLIRLRTALYSSLFAKGRNISTILSDMGEYYSTMNLSKDDLSPSGQECILYGELFTTYGRVITEIKSRTNIAISSGTTLSSSNDLLFPASTTVDALSLVSPSAISKNGVILGGDMFGIRLNENYNNRYMSRLLFHCYRRKLASYAQGSTIIHLHYRDIEKIKIKVHPKIEQDRIAEALDMLDNRIELEQKIVKEYSSQKNYLVKMMFI